MPDFRHRPPLHSQTCYSLPISARGHRRRRADVAAAIAGSWRHNSAAAESHRLGELRSPPCCWPWALCFRKYPMSPLVLRLYAGARWSTGS